MTAKMSKIQIATVSTSVLAIVLLFITWSTASNECTLSIIMSLTGPFLALLNLLVLIVVLNLESSLEHSDDGTLVTEYPKGLSAPAHSSHKRSGMGEFRLTFSTFMFTSVWCVISTAALLLEHQQKSQLNEQRKSLHVALAPQRTQIDTLLAKLPYVLATATDSVFEANEVDSVWLVSPKAHTVSTNQNTLGWKWLATRKSNKPVFVGVYTYKNAYTQNSSMPLDIIDATKKFCSKETNGYTEYASCLDVVTTKTTVTRKLDSLITSSAHQILVRSPWTNTVVISDSLILSGSICMVAHLTNNKHWSDDSATVTEQTVTAQLQIKRDNNGKWQLESARVRL